jgi:hypothetical protein
MKSMASAACITVDRRHGIRRYQTPGEPPPLPNDWQLLEEQRHGDTQ